MTGWLTAETDVVVVTETVDGVELAADVELFGGVVQVADGGVLFVAAEDLLGLLRSVVRRVSREPMIGISLGCILVWLVDIVDSDNGQMAVIAEITKSNTLARLDANLVDLLLGDVEGNWHGEQGAVRKTHILDDTSP